MPSYLSNQCWLTRLSVGVVAAALLMLLASCDAPASSVVGLPTVPHMTEHEVTRTTILTRANPGPATASCPQGQLALGGGWSLHAQGASVFAAMLTGNTWNVSVRAATPPVVGIAVTAYVECLAGAGAAAHVIPMDASQTVPALNFVDPETFFQQVITCPVTGPTTGMGFDLSSAPTFLEMQRSIVDLYGFVPLSTVIFSVANYDTVPHPATLVAYCLAGVSGTHTFYPPFGDLVSVAVPTPTSGPVPSGTTQSFTMSCARDPSAQGSVAIGGGWEYTYNKNLQRGPGRGTVSSTHAVLLGDTPVGWQVKVSSTGGAIQGGVVPAVICLQFPATGQNK
jgi:hypothetical protein